MAGRPKKSENNEINTDTTNLEKENAKLKAKLEEMMKFIENMESNKAENSDVNVTLENTSLEMRTLLNITSLSTGGINLKTSINDNGRTFRLERLGQTIPITYEDLVNCINCDRWIFEDGLVYINNEQAVRENYLEENYKNFLTIDKITHILDFDKETINNMIANTTKEIQNTICVLIADKINKNEDIDMNKVSIIEKVCDTDVRELAKKRR